VTTTQAHDPFEGEALATLVAEIADSKNGQDTVVLDVGEVLAITGYFVVTSAPNTRLVRTIADEIEFRVKQRGGPSPLRVEGLSELTWVLIDYGDVVVHVFLDEMRRFYDIERLYRDVPKVPWAPAVGQGVAADAGDLRT
jgi:ribosome-associated protein